MSASSTVLVVGVGYVGSLVAENLATRGHRVLGLRRSTRELPSGVTPLVGNVATGEGLDQIPSDVDAIVYAVSPGERSDEAYRLAFPVGVERIGERAPEARFVFVSSTAVYGEDQDDLVDDETPARPTTATALRLVEAETWLMRRGANAAILRASGIYGPGRTSLARRLARSPPAKEEGATFTNRIHRVDLARAIEFVLARPNLTGTFIASDQMPSTLEEMAAWLRARNLPSDEAPPPRARREGEPRKSRKFRASRLESAGFTFRYPSYRDGYAELFPEASASSSA